MLINADFTRRAALAPERYQWVPSPQNGVERVMLDRVGAEKARATSIVRYAPESYFPHHMHPGGEEILVLSGTFSADNIDYPAGWYLRNPPNSGHQPYSKEGAVIFVKLWQMLATETRYVAIDTNDAANWQKKHNRDICQLFLDDSEQVSLQRLKANEALFTDTVFTDAIKGGAEILVLDGELIDTELTDDAKTYTRGGWLRLPVDALPQIKAGVHGATVYLKTGHLSKVIGAKVEEK
ncbi:cupin domain-containing protein [Psychrobacter faecalis]|jgi:anti-sigma factor ChrR (cupin superfamily)|uniref:cupin domain-containing protein n=1 Tax=Psychrobacter faecalis TaxID=180588 RepID=UPI00191A0A97|nr:MULTISPECIES: cupin domain-containing protein [Psychrobacter]MCG3861718.1 cupin domain-containing protein [Psychrobacter sp. Ps5]